MDPFSELGSGGSQRGQLDFMNGEAQGRKRRRTLTGLPPELERPPGAQLGINRRMSVLSKLHQRRPFIASLKSFWRVVLEALEETDPHDIPFALLYSVSDGDPDHVDPGAVPRVQITPDHLILEGVVGLDKRNPDAALFLSLIPQELCREPHVAEPIALQIGHTSPLSRAANAMVYTSKGPVNTIMICPVFAHHTNIAGFILLGLDSQTHDEAFEIFAQILAENVSKSISNILLYSKLQDVQLASEALLRRVEEAERSNFMFRHMAESATVGCAIFDPHGRPEWLNEAYLNLTGVAREDFRPGIWQKAILPEDLSKVEGRWKELASGKPIVPFTFRVKRHQTATAEPGYCESQEYRWLLSNAYVDFDEKGGCRRVMGWLTDISAQKWNEKLQAQRLEDALEARRQTERFIDMVSHEIRNPLSAIIQTADGILASIDHKNEGAQPHSTIIEPVRDSISDAGRTIILCAQHQKRIVDDILTLSKLDSNLLLICPIQVRPRELVQNAVKMFEAELSSAQIEASISVDASFEQLSINTVLLDESRVMQILLNLISNAIKFTRNRTERYVRIHLAASLNRPSIGTSEISYIAPRLSHLKHLTSSELSLKEEIYLKFDVEDTGPGLDKDDMERIFQRFSQASPKTYSYGGFGLGLFICRELAELQGGQIGLSSVLGEGTTFTFYVQAKHCDGDSPKPPATSSVRLPEHAKDASLEDLNGNPRTVDLSRPATANPSTTNIDPKTLHILVAEDNKINQNVLARQLRIQGCTVHTADDGLQALEFLSRTAFNASHNRDNKAEPPNPLPSIQLSAILMDLEMPVMDGLTCVRRIRELEAQGIIVGHVPVIAVTANARSDQISEAMEAGMDSVLSKPFRIPELLSMIDAVFKGKGKVGV